MAPSFMTIEGYDGSGKTTLATSLERRWQSEGSLRIVGRKNEPGLRAISAVVENETSALHAEVEMLMRVALETERGHIIEAALADDGLVACDRGVISLRAWFAYLGVRQDPFNVLFERIEERYRDSLTIVCTSDFETCWARIADRSLLSRKEKLGADANRRFFEAYQQSVEQHIRDGFDVVRLDTARTPINETVAEAIAELNARGLWPAGGNTS